MSIYRGKLKQLLINNCGKRADINTMLYKIQKYRDEALTEVKPIIRFMIDTSKWGHEKLVNDIIDLIQKKL